MSNKHLLYPQLMPGEARRRAYLLRNQTIGEAVACALNDQQTRFSQVPYFFTASGGAPQTPETLVGLAVSIRNVAREYGYSATKGSDSESGFARPDFDVRIAIQLYEQLTISPHQASKEGVWELFTCVLLPDVVRWRFPGTDGTTPEERFTGGVRNAFGRLWWRAFLLAEPRQQDPYQLLRYLGEDELVQITERPGQIVNARLSRAVATTFKKTVEEFRVTDRSQLMRDAMKFVTRATPLLSLDSMTDQRLDEFLRALFTRVAQISAKKHKNK